MQPEHRPRRADTCFFTLFRRWSAPRRRSFIIAALIGHLFSSSLLQKSSEANAKTLCDEIATQDAAAKPLETYSRVLHQPGRLPLEPNEKQALVIWESSDYKPFNQYLRHQQIDAQTRQVFGSHPEEKIDELAEQLDRLVAKQPYLEKPLTLYRGVTLEQPFAAGQVETDSGFSTTSTSPLVATHFARHGGASGVPIVLAIQVPVNMKVLPVSRAHPPHDMEVLLPRNISFRFGPITGHGDVLFQEVEVVWHDMMLEHP